MPKKTVIVGLGGTGDWVLTFLKSRLYAAYAESEVKEDVQFLLVDTIHAKTRESAFNSKDKRFQVQSVIDQHEEEVAHLGAVRVEQHEYVPLTGEIHQVAESVRLGQDEHTRHLRWFSADYYLRSLPAAAMNITDGAGQWRQFGRMALTLSTERNEFPQRIERAIRAANLPPGDALMFYVVSSLAGGTGAGTFLDAAAMIRDIAKRNDVKVWVVGFLVLPSAFRRVLGDTTMEATVTRSFAAFRELVRFQTQAGQNVPFQIRYSLNHDVEITTKLFDTVFTIDAQIGRKNLADVPPWSGISPSIADGLEVFIDRTAGSVILQDLINASARMASQVRMDETLPAQFHSMGSYKIVLPARQFGTIFASQFVIDFLREIFATSEESGLAKLRSSDRTAGEYQELAREFAGKVPNLFTYIVDMLGSDARGQGKLRGFAGRPLGDYRSFLRPKETPQGIDLQVLTHNPIQEVQNGKVVGDNAEDAAKRIVRDCQRRLDNYWEKLDKVINGVVEQLDREVAAELNHQTREILNRRVEGYQDHPVGTAMRFLQQIVLLCDDLTTRVLKVTENAIDAQNSGQNSVGHWQSQLSLAQTSMEATQGCDGFFNRGRAWDAQNAYLEVQTGYLERLRLAKLFGGFHAIVDVLKRRSAQLAANFQEWANTATLDERFSARVAAERDISEIEEALLRAGESFTSSYGLVAYEQGSKVDPSMDGYRQELYERFARPLLKRWLESPEWDLRTQEAAAGDAVELTAVLTVPKASAEGRQMLAKSGKDLYQSIYEGVSEELISQVTNLSIFDYFLDKGFTAEQVAEFLKENSGALIGSLKTIEGATPTPQVHLLAQRPAKTTAVDFLNDLQNHLRQTMKENLQEGQERTFDNPYTLTMLHVVQDIREGQLEVMDDYEKRYNQQLRESDAHVINHIFTCEQEAAQVEKTYLLEGGHAGSGGWKRLHPRIVRLLDRPERLRLFLQLWALEVIRLVPNPEDKMVRIWMVLPPGADDPGGSRVVWLTGPPAGDRPTNLSPLFAMEQFCFVGKSAKPGGSIPIPYPSLEKAIKQKRNTLIASQSSSPYDELLARYETFRDEELRSGIEGGVDPDELADDEGPARVQANDLIMVCQYYLKLELKRLGKMR